MGCCGALVGGAGVYCCPDLKIQGQRLLVFFLELAHFYWIAQSSNLFFVVFILWALKVEKLCPAWSVPFAHVSRLGSLRQLRSLGRPPSDILGMGYTGRQAYNTPQHRTSSARRRHAAFGRFSLDTSDFKTVLNREIRSI
jgi:hypothetical protein